MILNGDERPHQPRVTGTPSGFRVADWLTALHFANVELVRLFVAVQPNVVVQ